MATVYMRVGLDKYGESIAEIVHTKDKNGFETADKQFRINKMYRQVDF